MAQLADLKGQRGRIDRLRVRLIDNHPVMMARLLGVTVWLGVATGPRQAHWLDYAEAECESDL